MQSSAEIVQEAAVSQQAGQQISLRIATYNILNTKDRYGEREALVKQNLFDLGADLVGLQEVVFGEKQLDELKMAKAKRHLVETRNGSPGFECYTAPVQIQIFKMKKNPDSNAQLDGNAILRCLESKVRNDMIREHQILHLSATRNCHYVKIDLQAYIDGQLGTKQDTGRDEQTSCGRNLFFVNTHLHDLIDDDYQRTLQTEQMLFWLEAKVDYESDVVVIVGDFNAKPDSRTYSFFLSQGFVSGYSKVHGAEPDKTFPTGLQAEFMDTDPPGTFDYAFIKGKGVTVTNATRQGGEPSREDQTIYGSDHFSMSFDLLIDL